VGSTPTIQGIWRSPSRWYELGVVTERRRHERAKSGQATPIQIRPARFADLNAIAHIGSASFSGLRPLAIGRRWVRACWSARPRMRYWVASQARTVLGYILWMEKGGFRPEAVIELEQVAVAPGHRGQGIGDLLVRSSVQQLSEGIVDSGRQVKVIEVTTGSEQGAIGFYQRSLGAEVVATIPDLFRGDEYVLIARPHSSRRR
jgi:ribosomal protein S18 acetylase RimI-like enzyme